MNPDDLKRRYVRKPKPESKIADLSTSRWYAYDASGDFKGEVLLTNDTKKRYEAKGFTFRRKFQALQEWMDDAAS